MRIHRYLIVVALALLGSWGCHAEPQARDVVYQVSTINALLEGAYDGEWTFAELKRHGDFGLGTFNALDGEMIMLAGNVYQITSDGKACPAADSMKTPFAVVTFLEPEVTARVDGCDSYEQLQQAIDRMLPTKNLPWAIKVEGVFEYVKTRSVPKQSRPYPKLVEVVKRQPTFEFHDARGTLVGFRLPQYLEGVNVPGYHLHLVTADRASGGHLLQCRSKQVRVTIDRCTAIHIALPGGGDFHEVDLTGPRGRQLEQVEK